MIAELKERLLKSNNRNSELLKKVLGKNYESFFPEELVGDFNNGEPNFM